MMPIRRFSSLPQGSTNIEHGAAILDRIRACRDDIDALITEYGDQREERA